MRAAVIWNPMKVRRGDVETIVNGAAGDAELSWFETAADDGGRRAVHAALQDSPALLFVAGGDGTVRTAAEILAEEPNAPTLAIIPLGTGNLLARNLGVPLNPRTAARYALRAGPRAIDFGWVDSEPDAGHSWHGFAVMVGFGLDANMIAATDEELKAKVGWLAYVRSIGRAIVSTDLVPVGIGLDERVERRLAHTVIIGNCGLIQGGITLFPDARVDDGAFDVLLLSAAGLAGWSSAVRTLLWDHGVRRALPGLTTRVRHSNTAGFARAKQVRVSLPDARPFQIDGDHIGRVKDFVVSMQTAGLRVAA